VKARLVQLADALRGSYWFLPALMAFAAILLAGAMVWIDTHVGSAWMDRLPWLYAARPDGARQVLSAIGGSMITVAGTVFSVTIASVVFASGQYGPRLLSNFMGDRGNQVTLGTFIATFVYCLLVLRTIRSTHEDGGAGFVPNLALLLAVALALASIGVLIFFIHHVPSRLHINSVIEGVGKRLLAGIDDRFPRFIGQPQGNADVREPGAHPPPTPPDAAPITADAVGYIQFIDDETLLRLAQAHDLQIRLRRGPGDFIHAGTVLVEAWPAERCNKELRTQVAATFAVGSRRSALQDLAFLIDELVEIASRALSPGVNDAQTAMTCFDWLGAAMSALAARELPSTLRADAEGSLRVIALPTTFEGFLERGFGALIQHAAADMAAALRLLATLDDVALACRRGPRREALAAYAGRLSGVAEARLTGDNLQRVRAAAADLDRRLAAGA
jgi:uncharacterized membrane protein